MVIDVFGLLSTNDFDSEIKVGRLGVESKKKQFICEYRWEKVED